MAAVHKSLIRECLGTTAAVVPGEVLVASGVRHPTRGYVRGPAAALLADHLRHRGLTVPPAVTVVASEAESWVGELHLVSYLDRDGGAVGLGAAVACGDVELGRAVDDALTAWTAALRTRRVITAATRPWCAGAVQALAAADRSLDRATGPVYLYGRLTDNPAVLVRLRERGLIEVTDVDAVPDGATVLFAQHGVALAVSAEAAARGLAVIDATCPLAAAAHAEVRRFADRGEAVVLVGRERDAAVPGLIGQAPEAVVPVGSVREAAAVRVPDPARVAFVVQPGVPREQIAPIVAELRARFGHPVPQHPATLCDAADDRNAAVRAMAESCDTVLVACGDEDPETAHLRARIRAAGAAAYPVARLADLRPEWIAHSMVTGLTATTRADPDLPGRLAEALAGLGPCVVVEQQVATRPAATSGAAWHRSDRPAARPA